MAWRSRQHLRITIARVQVLISAATDRPLISIEHTELLSGTSLLVLCFAWLVTSHCICAAAWAN